MDRKGRFPIGDQIGHSNAVEKVSFDPFFCDRAIPSAHPVEKVDFFNGMRGSDCSDFFDGMCGWDCSIEKVFEAHRISHQADYCADPIPSFRFWSGRKNNDHSCKTEKGFLSGDGARVIRFVARVIQQLGFWIQKIQANVDYCGYVRRRAECTSLGPRLKHPSLSSDSSLAAKSRAEALHVIFFFNKASQPRTSCCSGCTLVDA